MPVLEREVDLIVPNPAVIEPSHPNIFPSTVTPPPTPPLTESPDIDEIKRELKSIDQSVFESRLSPVEDGIKLKINRLCDEGAKAKESKIQHLHTSKQEIKPECVQNNPFVDAKHVPGPIRENHLLNTGLSTSRVFSETLAHIKAGDPAAVLPGYSTQPTGNAQKKGCVVDRRKSEGTAVPAPSMPNFTSATQHHKPVTSPIKANIKPENLPNGGISMVQTPYG